MSSTLFRNKRRAALRWFGGLCIALLPACANCIDNSVNPAAVEHNSFCAEYIAKGRLDQAEARCQLAIEFGPKYAEPRNNMGQIAVARGFLDQATEWFKEAISLRDDFAEAHNNLGFVFEQRREYNQAADAFLQAIEIDPGYQVARRNYATMLLYLGKPEEARSEYLKCMEVDPTFCDCRMGLGVIELGNEEWTAAVSQFERLVQVCPNNETGWYNLCYSYMRMGECDQAVNACLSAVSINNEYIEARQNLTEAYSCLALQDEVLTELIDQIKQNPGDPEPHFK
ncbi:MAG: tetratricopeptide repeat protein, partial [Myxococcota bacterium]